MRIATLQFDSRVGAIAANFSRAESLLMREERSGNLDNIDLLVLPELAFTGYNHPSLASIAPYLEPTADGPSTRWAIRTATRLKCTVAVGYPEAATPTSPSADGHAGIGNYDTAFDAKITADEGTIVYNSLVFVDSTGQVVAHYRKSFLFYSDEPWAQEGSGFYSGILPIGNGGQRIKAAAGICMDINPYKFEAPWSAYEFANHARESRAKVVIVSMAWLTRLTALDMLEEPLKPDMDTLGYWIERFRPLMEVGSGSDDEIVIVLANRTGDEGSAPRIGDVRYAGSSAILGVKKGNEVGDGNVKVWDILGRAQDGMLLVDTNEPAKYSVKRQAPMEVPVASVEELEKINALQTSLQAR